jgi:NAD+ kinase
VQVNLVVNSERSDALRAAQEAIEWLNCRGYGVGAEIGAADKVGAAPIDAKDICAADLVVSFGGDGTLIRAAHLCSEAGTPLLGVHYGRFGFVTQCRAEEVGMALERFFAGEARIENRMMLEAEVERDGANLMSFHCLNEAALVRAATSKMLSIEVVVDDHWLTRYPADGVLVATPTGSSAYNMSSGGPLMDPSFDALILSAISPHTMSARPLVLRPESRVQLRVLTGGETVLSLDGNVHVSLADGDIVCATRSKRITRLVMQDEGDFLIKLRERLLWSKGLPGQFD